MRASPCFENVPGLVRCLYQNNVGPRFKHLVDLIRKKTLVVVDATPALV